jgi:hypothetical protein
MSRCSHSEYESTRSGTQRPATLASATQPVARWWHGLARALLAVPCGANERSGFRG